MFSDKELLPRWIYGGGLPFHSARRRSCSALRARASAEFVPMDVFLQRFINDQRTRIQEPPNGYNAEDPGMKIVAPLINAAIGG